MIGKFSPLGHVLVVDDEPLIRWSLNERLSSAGYHVQEAADGASALGHFRHGKLPVDLVMLDLKLPDTDGLDLLKTIKRLSPACRVVMITAFATTEKVAEALGNGAFDVIAKPFELERVLHTVQRALA